MSDTRRWNRGGSWRRVRERRGRKRRQWDASEPLGGSANAGSGGDNDSGGANNVAAGGVAGSDGQAACADYVDWLRATFPYPNGILGVADAPTMPWQTVSGAFKTASGWAVATGASTAVLNEGKSFSYEAARLRFKAKVAATDQEIVLALNADSVGTGGLTLHLGAETGALSLEQAGKSLGSTALGALTPGNEYFVTLTLTPEGGAADVATGNFAGVPGASLVGSLASSPPKQDAGTFVALIASGTGVSFDNLAH